MCLGIPHFVLELRSWSCLLLGLQVGLLSMPSIDLIGRHRQDKEEKKITDLISY